jgi:DNA-binding LacI/PurR family transcriptional regulator
VVIPGFLIHFYASAISGIQNVASQTGYNVMICQSNESYETEVNNVRAMVSGNIAGLIISMSRETTNQEHFKQLFRKGLPMVFFNRVSEEIETSKVIADDYEGAFEAVEHLIEVGCKRIAHIGGPKNLMLSKNRLQGYLDALKKHNIQVENDLIIHGDFSMENGIECTRRLLELQQLPDGIFAICDSAAFGSMLAIKEKGYKIPQDIAICGFTNEPSTILVEPKLTSVSQPCFEIGEAAADLFLEQVVVGNGHFKPKIKILKTTLIKRESTLLKLNK